MSLVPSPLDLLPVFNAQPGATLLLSPDWVILGASDDYLAATLTQRETIVGQYIFDAFPDNPEAPEANAVANVRASLAQVLATKKAHEMAPQHYDVPNPAQPGQFVERYWQPRHTPVLDAQGQVQFIIQSVQDITANRLAERQLHESQHAEQAARAETENQRQRLFHILENFPAVVASYRGPEHVFDLVSHRFQQDFPTRSIKGLPVREALPELEGQGYYDILDGVYHTGEPFYGTEIETWVDLTNTGKLELHYYNVCFQATRDAQGHIDGILNFAYDVTEAVLARQQVQQLNQELEARVKERTSQLEAAQATTERQRRQWHELFMRAPAGICIFDGPEWVYEFVNPGYQAMFPGRALLGKRLVDALPEVVDQPLMAILHRVYDTGEPFDAREVLVPLARTEGGPVEDIYFDLTYQARYNEAGQIDGFVTYAYDVTAQVLAQREREAQQHLVNTVFEQAPAGIWVVRGPDYVFELVNPMMTQILGHTQEQLLGRPYFKVLAELGSQRLPELFRQVWEQGEPVFVEELAAQLAYHAPGEVGYFTFVFQPLRDKSGQVTRISCVALDVTKQVLARQQVQALNGELASLNQALQTSNSELNESNLQLTRTNVDLDTFVYTASHDLKAPITNIEGILEALRETLLPAVQQQAVVAHLLGLLDHTVRRFLTTIDQLTDLSRLQRTYKEPAELLALAPIVAGVVADLAPVIDTAAAQVQVEVPDELQVSFAPASLRSIVYNLLSNAVKYRDPARPAQVWLQAEAQPSAVVLRVRDNGLGLTDSQQRRLFGVFQRLHTHVAGTGVGLYMIKRLIENGGASISVTSTPGVGSTFAVTFPTLS
jgi:PAS domain S-box-containing protein